MSEAETVPVSEGVLEGVAPALEVDVALGEDELEGVRDPDVVSEEEGL